MSRSHMTGCIICGRRRELGRPLAAVGGFATRPDLAAEYVRMGARYVSTGTDLGFLLAACTAKAKEVHGVVLD